jgi:hypothetical protein
VARLCTSCVNPGCINRPVFARQAAREALYAGEGKAYDTRFVQGAKLLPLSQIAGGKNVVALRPTSVSEEKKQAEVIYMRYDDQQMKYVYLCVECDTVWKTDERHI